MANNFSEFKSKILDPICLGKRDFYDNLSDSEQKGLAPLVLMRWLSGTLNELQILLINEFVNPYVFPLFREKKLLIYLLQANGPKSRARLSWNKTASKKTTKTPTIIEVIKEYYHYSTIQAKDVLSLLDDEIILQCAEELGRQPDEIKLIKKELKSRK